MKNNNLLIFHIFLIGLSFSYIEKVSGQSSRIVGGVLAQYEFGKFYASIQNLTQYHVCGGGIVSRWLVVTAAHCVDGVNPDYMKIVAGTNYLGAGGKQNDVTEVIIHDKYNASSRNNDIALLRTKTPFDLRFISVLGLRKQELIEGDDVLIAGFGAQEPNGVSSNHLKSFNITVFSQETCEFAMRYSMPITKEMFCTFSWIGQGTCHGDSGSPVVKGNDLVGVVSWGIPCGVGFPDVHTRISPFVDWIQKHIHRIYCEPYNRPLNVYQKLQYLAKHLAHVSTEHLRFLKMVT